MKSTSSHTKSYNAIVMIVFLFLLFSKQILFHWNVYHSLAISSIINNSLYFWSFWMPKIAIILFMASFIFISKRCIWSVVCSFVLDIWMLANMMYLRSNGLLLDGYAFTMAGNMDGFWNSCWGLLMWKDFIPFFASVLYMLFVIFVNHIRCIKQSFKIFIIVFIVSVIINWLSFVLVRQFACRMLSHGIGRVETIWESISYNPFKLTSRADMKPLNKDYAFENYSLIHGIVFDLLDYVDIQNEMSNPYELSSEDYEMIAPLIGKNVDVHYDNVLLIVLVESLESWAIQPEIMPNLCKFLDNHFETLVRYSKSQIVGGSSGDGQMIINTGLLPVQEGATCFRFPFVTFPSIVNKSDSSVTILTHNAECWNQTVMSQAYGYTHLIEGDRQDDVLVERILDYIRRGYKTIQAITITSHIPFAHADESSLETPKDMPNLMSKYCKSLHITDNALEQLFKAIETLPEFRNATIVITGDHSVFWSEIREEFSKWCKSNDCDWPVEIDACPVIYFSPFITKDVCIEEMCYQMDIFPTLLYLTGNNDYLWKGFGVNVLDSAALKRRPISEPTVYQLSDKLIRANWFSTLK